jgi:hypothetical protein
MSSSPSRPGEITEHEKRVLEECARTFDEDIKEARPAEEVMKELRQKLKELAPK